VSNTGLIHGSKNVSIPGSVGSDIRRISESTGQIVISRRREDRLETWELDGAEQRTGGHLSAGVGRMRGDRTTESDYPLRF
jgi:hypothetical protein